MKIESLEIENFRGVKRAYLRGLGRLVVVAGENGSGKSCIFDAIKLLKSAYGGYQPNEISNYFSELQIDLQKPDAMLKLANDKNKPVRLLMQVSFSDYERDFLKKNARELIEESIWKIVSPNRQRGMFSEVSLVAEQRENNTEVQEKTNEQLKSYLKEMRKRLFVAELKISTNGYAEVSDSKVLEIAFSNYRPKDIGLIDFHGPNRVFNRQIINNINVDINSGDEQQKSHALYNYQSKYSNIKSEMAGAYVRSLIARQTGVLDQGNDLIDALSSLFTTFFPSKKFLGPQPRADGGIEFPVKIGDSSQHDIDDLSSGEKEILYGYLRLYNSSPNNFVILLDEPELHLNPKLIRMLPDFYYKYLGVQFDTQIWLITHSDALIRDAIGNRDYSIFHMVAQTEFSGSGSQAVAITPGDELQKAVFDLVGDAAAYAPGAATVILESQNSEFDVKMVSNLFPEFAGRVNLIAGTNKRGVKGVYKVLQNLYESKKIGVRVYAIVDRDHGFEGDTPSGLNALSWDVYHIENYLVEPSIILDVVRSQSLAPDSFTLASVKAGLKAAAKEVLPSVVAHLFRMEANDALVKSLEFRVDVTSENLAEEFEKGVARSRDRFIKVLDTVLTTEQIGHRVSKIAKEQRDAFKTTKWMSTVPGRAILKRFIDAQNVNVGGYEPFRNLILGRMREIGFKPVGMQACLDKIVSTL